MKTLTSFLVILSGVSFAGMPADPGNLPREISPSEWSDISAAHEAARHAPQRQADGNFVARNPGQQWSAEFDGRGVTVKPDQGDWTWGLELTGYGECTLPAAASPAQRLRHEGGKIRCPRDENLSEWFVNDSRGLEQGWDIRQRPERADPAAPLLLHLTTRGNVRPQVSASGDSVSFLQGNGDSALSYGGLKAWDADGKTLAVRFEPSGERGLRIAVEDQDARYPVTIDPVAQQTVAKIGSIAWTGQVAVSGDTVAIGNSVFIRDGGAWSWQATLRGSNTESTGNLQTDDLFGTAVAISGDTLVIGAPKEDSAATGVNGDGANNAAANSGAAYVFVRSGSTWTQQAYLKANNTGAGDGFGGAVAISGDTIVVGANGEDGSDRGVNGDSSSNGASGSGAAYVFARSGTTWTQQAYLKSSDPKANDRFGDVVAVSGDTVVVGAYFEGSNQAGGAYVFARSGSFWSQEAHLQAGNTYPGDWFGCSVAISGETVVVGAYRESLTYAGINHYGYRNADWAGAAYVFVRNGGTWPQQAYLKASNAQLLDYFGTSVAISGDTVAVGAPGEDGRFSGLNGNMADGSMSEAGAVYLFKRSGTTWTQDVYLKEPATSTNASFGRVLAASGQVVVAGAANTTTVTEFFTSGSEIHIKQAATDIYSGGTFAFPPVAAGGNTELSFTVANLAVDDLLLTGTPKVAITGSGDFTVSAQPDSPIAGAGASTTFKVRFAPTSEVTKSATLSIPNTDADEGLFLINLSGPVLSFDSDTDGDGLSDASEFNMAALGFNWQLKQTALVKSYFDEVNRGGLYAKSQVQVLRAGHPTLTRNPSSGQLTLSMDWKKSINLTDFFNFAPPAGSSVSINPAGGIDLEFPSLDNNAVFIRVERN